jgi:hypothetical protein
MVLYPLVCLSRGSAMDDDTEEKLEMDERRSRFIHATWGQGAMEPWSTFVSEVSKMIVGWGNIFCVAGDWRGFASPKQFL